MLNRSAIAKHERNNSAVAADVLRNRASQPLALILWAEIVQRRQSAERAERAEPVTTAPPAQRPLLLQGVARS